MQEPYPRAGRYTGRAELETTVAVMTCLLRICMRLSLKIVVCSAFKRTAEPVPQTRFPVKLATHGDSFSCECLILYPMRREDVGIGQEEDESPILLTHRHC